jgi:amino acid permease
MWRKLFRKKSITDILKQAADGNTDAHGNALAKSLGVRDLTAFGIAAIVGAGIFSTIGNASASSGPALRLLPVDFLPLLMQNSQVWCRLQEALIPTVMLHLEN